VGTAGEAKRAAASKQVILKPGPPQ